MADTVQERVGNLEQEVHTIKYQISEVRDLRPRVGELEKAFEGLAYLRADQAEIKAELKTVGESQQRIAGDIEGFSRAVKVIGGLMALAAIATAAVVWVTVTGQAG